MTDTITPAAFNVQLARSWTLTLDASDGWPPSLNARLHWAQRAKQTKAWRQRVYVAAAEARIPHMERALVSISFHTAIGRRLDPDNLVSKCKALYDGLVGCYTDHWTGQSTRQALLPGVLPDDDAKHMERGPVTEVRDGKRTIEILVEELG